MLYMRSYLVMNYKAGQLYIRELNYPEVSQPFTLKRTYDSFHLVCQANKTRKKCKINIAEASVTVKLE